ncbi:hypothetical protein [Pseudophaeobacter leonis]|uniref:hypothetical protein n=1 Tax=Pseudophaeobacter leonis TaxID=1144477 RepID=UPI0009F27F2E|nr:hypothetical protein [Pseudophaeobacter leonis]
MSGVIPIPKAERSVIRVFDLDMPPEQARFLAEPGALAQVLGLEDIDLDHVEIFPVSDLEELGLAGCLIQGCGIPEEDVAPDRAALTAIKGYVLLLRSRAFAGAATRLTPASQITLVASYGEKPINWSAPAMPETDSSRLYSGTKLPPRAARAQARRIGASLFAVVMCLFALILYALVT